MHIPDGFLTPPVWLTLDVIAAPAVAWAARRAPNAESNSSEGSSRIPLMGVMGAFVFAAQMINFPLGFGTSAHLLGGTLLATVLGPAAAALVMTSVLIVQALMFQDGGVLALGANVLNMGIAGVVVGYLPIWLWGRGPVSIFTGGALSVLTSGALALWELGLSGIAISGPSLYFTAALFLIAGFIEGATTVAAVRAIARLSPQSFEETPRVSFHARYAIVAIALILVSGGVWIACAAPDNLQHLAGQVGLQENPAWTHAPFAGYQMAGFGPNWWSRPLVGMLGLVCAFAVCAIGGKRRQRGA